MKVNDYRYKTYHRRLVEKVLAQHRHLVTGRTLDIGALKPRYNYLFNAQITAVDLVANDELGVLYGDIQQGLSFADETFDSIICIEVFLYLDQYEKAISEIHRLLKPGGRALISTPFLCRDMADRIRLTEGTFLEEFRAFTGAKAIRLGNGYTVIWDILRNKIYGVRFKLLRYLLFGFILPYLGIIKLFGMERWIDDYYSGLFFVLQK
jgi:SAM-dependent methyltransferase